MRAERVLVEVKSTRTDGSRPFPMSRHEWDTACRCHDAYFGENDRVFRLKPIACPAGQVNVIR